MHCSLRFVGKVENLTARQQTDHSVHNLHNLLSFLSFSVKPWVVKTCARCASSMCIVHGIALLDVTLISIDFACIRYGVLVGIPGLHAYEVA